MSLVPRDLLCVSSVFLSGVSWILERQWGYNSVTHDLRLRTGIYRGDNSQASLISDPGDTRARDEVGLGLEKGQQETSPEWTSN